MSEALAKKFLPAFKEFLDIRSIAYREGKGQYQALQVMTRHGYQILYNKNAMPDHYLVPDLLIPVVNEFVDWLGKRQLGPPQEYTSNVLGAMAGLQIIVNDLMPNNVIQMNAAMFEQLKKTIESIKLV